MNILMIDTDSKHGDLYLRQLSTYHKSKGDIVYYHACPVDPDIVYIGCMFTKNRGNALGTATLYPNSEVYLGGTGINLNSDDLKIAKLKPDYDLYPNDKWAIGRATWGCPNKCDWCCVPQKEGKFKKWVHPKNWYDDRFDTIWLLDNNFLTNKKWFFEVTDWILDMGLKLKEGGVDFRYLDKERAERLKELKFIEPLHFAWDSMEIEGKVLKGIELLKEFGFNTRSGISVYILTKYNTTPEQDYYRVKILRDLNVNPYVMVYNQSKGKRGSLQWRVNRKHVFWSDTWDEGLFGGGGLK